MQPLLGLARHIDRLTDGVFRIIRWLTLVMILIGAINAGARTLTKYTSASLTSNAAVDIQWYLFSLVFLLGAAYGVNREVHVRVDVLYSRIRPQLRTWINLLGTLLFLIPFSATMLITSWPAVRNSWAVREASPDPGGLARYPIKTVILVCFALLLLQGVSQVIKHVATLTGALPAAPEHDPTAPSIPHHDQARST
ncbi:MAG: TRAP transporter small permease subunit [Gemmatimonadales bacterium]